MRRILAAAPEVARIAKFVQQQKFFASPDADSPLKSPWPLAAQALMMSNEFQYLD